MHMFCHLPYYILSTQELLNELEASKITKTDFINNNFLDDIKNLYHSDILTRLNFHYYTHDTFNTKFSDGYSTSLSLFHLNVKSLNKNSEELVQYISCLNFSFDILVLSEIWTYNIDLFRNLFPGYFFYYSLPTISKLVA